MSTKEEAISRLKESVKTVNKSIRKPLGENQNIRRGHYRSISSDIEDFIAVFVSEIVPENYTIVLDPSINVKGKLHRPDLLIIDDKQVVVAMVEIKANMGWCRDAAPVLEKMRDYHGIFVKQKELIYELSDKSDKSSKSNKESHQVTYSESTRCALVSLTEKNCTTTNHHDNSENAQKMGIGYFCLFTGWYEDLVEKDIGEFAAWITEGQN